MNNQDPYIPPRANVVTDQTGAPTYHAVGSVKLMLLSLTTLGVYDIYWCYKNWVHIKNRLDLDIYPFWRAVFAPLWVFSLSNYINTHAEEVGAPVSAPTLLIGGLFLALSVTVRLPDPYWLISVLTFVPLIALQVTAQRIAATMNTDNPDLRKYTYWHWIVIVLGGLFFILMLIGTFLPEPIA